MKKIIILLILCPFLTRADNWEYDKTQDDLKLYIHEVVNYNFNMDWDKIFQKENYKTNLARFSYGSISSRDLLEYEQLIINHKLDSKTAFRLYIDNYRGRYNEFDKNRRYLELHRKIYKNTFISVFSDPDYQKHTVDIGYGILYKDKDTNNYFHVNYIDEDFDYDDRNKIDGKTLKDPKGVRWKFFFEKDSLYIFSEGKVTNKFARIYENVKKTPELKYHSQANNFGTVAGGMNLDKWNLYLKFDVYDIFDKKNFYDDEMNYEYDKNIYMLRSNQVYPLGNKVNLKFEMDYIYQNSKARGYREYEITRTEKILGGFIDKRIKKNIIELGYFGSFIIKGKNESKKKDYIDKILLKWGYNFGDSKLQISISHVLQIQGFGGGNIQYFMLF